MTFVFCKYILTNYDQFFGSMVNFCLFADNAKLDNVMMNDVCWFKDAKVWIPDASVVWKCALLLDDYKGSQQALRVCYEEDGTVSMYMNL